MKQHQWNEVIRKRPAMFLGALNLTGFKEILEHSFEEIAADCLANPVFQLEFYQEEKMVIRITNADVVKVLKRLEESELQDQMKNLGWAVLISLSSTISVTLCTEESTVVLEGKKGMYEISTRSPEGEKNSVLIEYILDREIFKEFKVEYELVTGFLKQFAYLNPALKIISIDHTTQEFQRNVFHYPTGMFQQMDSFISQLTYGKPEFKITIEASSENFEYQIGLCYAYGIEKASITTYAGNIETFLGGSLNDGILEGFIAWVKSLAQKKKSEVQITKKLAKPHLIVFAVVKGNDLLFEGSTKRKLAVPEIQKEAKQLVLEKLNAYVESNERISEKVLPWFTNWEEE